MLGVGWGGWKHPWGKNKISPVEHWRGWCRGEDRTGNVAFRRDVSIFCTAGEPRSLRPSI